MISRAGFLLISIIVGTVAAAQSDQAGPGLYLFRIPGQNLVDASIDRDIGPFIDLHIADAARAAVQFENTSVTVIARGADFITVSARKNETTNGEPLEQHLAASFVIDFDEPSVVRLVQNLVDQYGERPDIGQLTRFAFDAIPEKTYSRGFDLASRVAEFGEGDCTEHAVLLTALTRATGRSARVVLGLQLVELGTEFFAYGHAWSEIHEGESWQIADATMPAEQVPEATIRYLPLLVLSNEGPGYSLDLANLISLYPSRVDLVPGSVLPGKE